MSIAFNYAAASHLGKVRKSNQDSGYAGPNLLVLADGMGGPAGGDIASAVAVDYLQLLDQQVPSPDSALQNLVEAEATAHDELCDHSNVNPELTGLGTTCIAILRSGSRLVLSHIGDSRAYLLRDGDLYQVTKDHSYVQQLIDEGQITADEATTHPHRSVLLRVLGDSQANPEVDTMVIEPEIGDRWLLCSDGLCGYVAEADFKEILIADESLQSICDKLVDLALEAGGIDNVTCVVADIVPGDSDNLPEEPVVVGSAADPKKLQTLRKHLQQTLQSESYLETRLAETNLPQDDINTPVEGIQISEVVEPETTPQQNPEDAPAANADLDRETEQETNSSEAEADENEVKADVLDTFAPEDAPEKKKGKLVSFCIVLALIAAVLVCVYMAAEYFGYHLEIPGLASQISINPDPNISRFLV